MAFGRRKSRDQDTAPPAFRPFVSAKEEFRAAVESRPVKPVRVEPVEPDAKSPTDVSPPAMNPADATPKDSTPSPAKPERIDEASIEELTRDEIATHVPAVDSAASQPESAHAESPHDIAPDKPLFETPESNPPPLEEVVGPWDGWRDEQPAANLAADDVFLSEPPHASPTAHDPAPPPEARHDPSAIAPAVPPPTRSPAATPRDAAHPRRSQGKVSLVDMVVQGSRGLATVPADAILSVRHLTTCFRTDAGIVTAVDDVSFDLRAGETLAIVGESGCGKTVTSKSIMRLLPPRTSFIKPGSEILFRSQREDGAASEPINLATAPEPVMRRVRGARIAMIFQEPMTSLNPVFTVGWQINEALKYHTDLSRRERRLRAIDMLKLVDIPSPERRIREYPHQLSGGMRQRVMIAIALCCEPDILIADEPTTALDVTIQAQILSLMADLKTRLNTAIIFITHNLGVVAQFCDRVMVMYAGRVIESGSVREVFHHPRHPYARALLDSIPKAGNKHKGRALPTIEGIVPSLLDLPKGCRFSERCQYRQDRCVAQEPELERGPDGRLVRCFYPLEDSRIRATTEARA